MRSSAKRASRSADCPCGARAELVVLRNMGRPTSRREAGPPARLGSPVPHDIATEAVVPHQIATDEADVEVRPADLCSRGDAAREGPQVGVAVLRRDALVHAYHQRYREAWKAEKGRLLDEFVARSGYHRKHAMGLLGHGVAGPRRPPFDDAVKDALVVSGRPQATSAAGVSRC